MRKFINNLKNPNFNFTGNFWKLLIIPFVVIITAVVLFFTVGFNYSSQLQGGSIVTVIAEDDVNLYKKDDYNALKSSLEDIFKDNKVTSESYQIIEISSVGMGLVVKLDTKNLSETERNDLNTNLLLDIKSELYSTTTLGAPTIEDYVKVESYAGIDISNNVLNSLLVSIIAIILISAYLMFRVNISSGVTAILFALFGNVFATALIIVCRIPLTVNTFIYIPVVTVLSALFSYVMYSRVDDVLDESEDNRKLPINQLANKVVAKSIFSVTAIVFLVAILILFVGSFNVQGIRYTSISLCVTMIAQIYSMIFLSPYIWAKGYIRKHKKAKVQTAETDKPEVNIMRDIMQQNPEDDIVRN